MGFCGGSDSKESACNAGDPGLISGLMRSSGEGNGYLIQYSLPGEFHGLKILVGYNPWGHKDKDTTEQRTLPFTFQSRMTASQSLPNYIYKDPISKQVHILRFWVDMNLGRTLLHLLQTPFSFYTCLPNPHAWLMTQHLPLTLGLLCPALSSPHTSLLASTASSLLSLRSQTSERQWSSVGRNSLDLQP